MKIFKTHIWIVAQLLIISATSSAQTMIDGICYEFNSKTLEAKVLPMVSQTEEPPKYAGAIDIPSEVKYNNNTYKVTEFTTGAFAYCTDLTSINISNSVSYIGSSAFIGCTSLTNITLPNTIKKIENCTFSSCINLTSITIPKGVTTISLYAFSNCDALTSIVLPSTIEYISPDAFEYSKALKSVTVNSPTPITIYSNTFEVFGELHVPAGSKEAYSKAPIWKNFTIIEDGETGIESIQGIPTLSSDKIFNISGQSLKAPRKGMNIINGKKVVVK